MKKSIIVAFLMIIVVGGVLAWRYLYIVKPYREAHSELFIYFPLDRLDADYFISKADNTYSVQYFAKGKENTLAGNPDDGRVLYIGSAPIDLDQFVNKKVKLSGSFINGVPYCKGECPKYIGVGTRPVVKIDSIALAE